MGAGAESARVLRRGSPPPLPGVSLCAAVLPPLLPGFAALLPELLIFLPEFFMEVEIAPLLLPRVEPTIGDVIKHAVREEVARGKPRL